MILKIPNSFVRALADRGIVPDFEGEVQRHAKELQDHFDHHEKIKTQPALPRRPEWADVAHEKDPAAAFIAKNKAWSTLRLAHRDPYPRPSNHPAVDQAVRFDGTKFVADYEIINDDPTPEQVLREKKEALLRDVSRAEEAALAQAQLPPGKQRLMNLIDVEIANADAAAMAQIVKEVRTDGADKIDVAAEVVKRRSENHVKHIEERDARRVRIEAIRLRAAQIMSDIEDLTTDNVDSFEIPSFDK